MGKQHKAKKTRRDVAEIARSVVEQAIGEKLNGGPLDNPNKTEQTHTKLRASKGGKGRAKKLTAERRSEIAKDAALVRWKKK